MLKDSINRARGKKQLSFLPRFLLVENKTPFFTKKVLGKR